MASLDDTPFRAELKRAEANARRARRSAVKAEELVAVGATAELDAEDAADAASAAEAVRSAAAFDLSSARITMPFAGVVLGKAVDIGTTISPGQPIITVADLSSPLVARVAVPTEATGRVRIGSRASIVVGGRDFAGRVIRVGAATGDDGNNITIVVQIEGGRSISTIVSGAAGSAEFAIDGAENGQVDPKQHIPAEALVESDGSTGSVFIFDPKTSTAQLTKLQLVGPSDSGWFVEGLPPNAKVVTAGAGFVSDGQRVSVLKR